MNCSVEGCFNVVKCRSLCRTHHEADLARRRAEGPVVGRITANPPLERLARRVEFSSDGCWLWTGGTTRDGYGVLSVRSAKRTAHATAWELLVGPVPAGLELDHLCQVRRCFNPDHLEPVTHAENMRRTRRSAA